MLVLVLVLALEIVLALENAPERSRSALLAGRLAETKKTVMGLAIRPATLALFSRFGIAVGKPRGAFTNRPRKPFGKPREPLPEAVW